MCNQSDKESILLREAKKLREILDGVIARLESGEGTCAGFRSEVDELRGKIIELLQGMEELRMEDIVEKLRKHTADAGKKFQEFAGSFGSSFDEMSRKAQGIFGEWFGKGSLSREELKAMIMSEGLAAEYFETMRKRNWTDPGIQESLDVFRQILLSMLIERSQGAG